LTDAELAVVKAAKAFVAHEKSESSSNWEEGSNWIEELKRSNSLSIPVEFLELVYAVEAVEALEVRRRAAAVSHAADGSGLDDGPPNSIIKY
jgi:hypothetical protein